MSSSPCRRLSSARCRRFWNVHGFPRLDPSLRRQGPAARLFGLAGDVRGHEGRPYRSLAGELRNLGGFAKDSTPFSEFLWADFLRRRIKVKDVRKDFAQALDPALAFRKSQEASYLPGWCAPRRTRRPTRPRTRAAADTPRSAAEASIRGAEFRTRLDPRSRAAGRRVAMLEMPPATAYFSVNGVRLRVYEAGNRTTSRQ